MLDGDLHHSTKEAARGQLLFLALVDKQLGSDVTGNLSVKAYRSDSFATPAKTTSTSITISLPPTIQAERSMWPS